jgi:integrase
MEKQKRGKRGEGCIYQVKNSANWYIKYYLNGKYYVEASASSDRKVAEKILKDRLAKKTLGRLVPGAARVTFEDMEQYILDDYKTNGKRSLDRVKISLENLREYFAGCRAEALTTDKINVYKRERQAEGAANASINRDLSALKRMFNLAIQAGRLSHRPYIPMLKEKNVRTGFFEANEFLTLREGLPNYLQPMVTFAYYTGWRKGEVLDLRWSQVDLHEKIIRLSPEQTKTGNGRVIAIDGELLGVLQAQWEARKIAEVPGHSPAFICPYVFHHHGRPIRDFRSAWENALKQAGLVGKIFHDLRRTAVRDMVRAGVHERVAMTISGHKTRSVFDRYDIVDEEDLKEAARKTSERILVQRENAKVVPIDQAKELRKTV